MGSGKTTVGKLLAKKTGRRFIDTDSLIEKETGKSIAAVFSEYGEPYFRELEYKTVAGLTNISNCVISVGGGAAAQSRTSAVLRSLGTVILLDVSEERMLSRLNGSNTRPMLGNADRLETASKLYKSRLPFYKAAADISVCADSSPEDVSEAIIKALCLKGI